MFRRTLGRLCAAGSSTGAGSAGGGSSDGHTHGDSHDPNVQYDYMTLALACSIFNYNLSDRFEKKELKKRFNKLALIHHPDRGGNDKNFHNILEAYKLLSAHRHDKGGEKGRYNFRHPRPRSAKEERGAPTAENPMGEETNDHKTFDKFDVLSFFVLFSLISAYYMYHALFFQGQLNRTRMRLTEDQMEDPGKLLTRPHDWHPWGATQDEKDQVAKLAVIQGSITAEEARLKAELKGSLPKSPFVH